MEQTDTSIVSLVAECIAPPAAIDLGGEVMAEYQRQAAVVVNAVRQVLNMRPTLLVELGWQSIDIRSEGDLLQRGVRLYAPPSRGASRPL